MAFLGFGKLRVDSWLCHGLHDSIALLGLSEMEGMMVAHLLPLRRNVSVITGEVRVLTSDNNRSYEHMGY